MRRATTCFRSGLLLALLLTLPAIAAAQTTTVVLVRHAERADDSRDSPLNDAGRARADALAEALADAGIGAIYTTQYQRTQQTAAPLGRRLGIEPRVMDPGGDVAAHARAIADRIRAEDGGRAVLVVGHSNTVPEILKALGGPEIPEIASADYEQMYVVIMSPQETRVVRARLSPGRPAR